MALQQRCFSVYVKNYLTQLPFLQCSFIKLHHTWHYYKSTYFIWFTLFIFFRKEFLKLATSSFMAQWLTNPITILKVLSSNPTSARVHLSSIFESQFSKVRTFFFCHCSLQSWMLLVISSSVSIDGPQGICLDPDHCYLQPPLLKCWFLYHQFHK